MGIPILDDLFGLLLDITNLAFRYPILAIVFVFLAWALYANRKKRDRQLGGGDGFDFDGGCDGD